MSLCSLPAELKLHITDFLEPQSLPSFALSTKEHLKLCNDRLKMFAKYHTIKPAPDGERLDIWDLTKEILQDPRKAWYVRDLNLVAARPTFHDNLSEDDATLFKAAAERILPLYSFESAFFATEHAGLDRPEHSLAKSDVWKYEPAVLVILLHHLTQLRTFRMTENLEHDFLLAFMRRVAEGYQDPALAPQMPLQHLHTAGIAHWDTEFSCNFDWAVYFMCVPSLRTFTALMMGSELGVEFFTGEEGSVDDPGDESHLRNTAAVPVSNVEHLEFVACQFDAQSFNTLLPMTKNLKTFSYDSGGHIVAYSDFDPRKVIKALANHCAHSLEQLELSELTTGTEVSYILLADRTHTDSSSRREKTTWTGPQPTSSRTSKPCTAMRAGSDRQQAM
jgi:hypothetical protein